MRERERKAKLKKREVFAIREDITIIFSYSFSYLQQHFPCFYIHLLLPRRPQTQNFSFYIVVIVVVANTSLLQQLFLSIVFVCDGEKQVSFLEKVLREKKKNLNFIVVIFFLPKRKKKPNKKVRWSGREREKELFSRRNRINEGFFILLSLTRQERNNWSAKTHWGNPMTQKC